MRFYVLHRQPTAYSKIINILVPTVNQVAILLLEIAQSLITVISRAPGPRKPVFNRRMNKLNGKLKLNVT